MQPAIRRAFFVSRFPEQPFRVDTSLPMLPFGGGLRKKMATDSTVAIRVHLLFFLTQLAVYLFTHPARLIGNRHDGDPCYRYCGNRGHRCRHYRPSR